MSSQWINRLPAEILSHILLFARAKLMRTYEPPGQRMKALCRCSMLLRRVCALWNTIITHTPEFWTEIRIPVPLCPNHLSAGPPSPSALSLWLERSGALPLHVAFTVALLTSTPLEPLPETLSILFRSVSRWETVEYTLCGEGDASFLNQIPPFTDSLLKSFTIHRVQGGLTGDKATVQIVIKHLSSAPNLRSLYISPLCVPFARAMTLTGSLEPVLNNLTSLKLVFQRRCWLEIWTVCRLCTSVISISVTGVNPFFGDDAETDANRLPATTLPNLRVLELRIDTIRKTFPSLLFLHAPNLRLLSITTSIFPDALIQKVCDSISAFGCSLHVLRLSEVIFDEVDTLLGRAAIKRIPIVDVLVYPQSLQSFEKMNEEVDGRGDWLGEGSWGEWLGKTVQVVKAFDIVHIGWVELSDVPPQLKGYYSIPGYFRTPESPA